MCLQGRRYWFQYGQLQKGMLLSSPKQTLYVDFSLLLLMVNVGGALESS